MPKFDGWLDELPLAADSARRRLGLRRVDESAWLEPDEQREAELGLKARLLAERRADVVAVAEGEHSTEAAQAATLALITDWLQRFEPGLTPAPTADGGRSTTEGLGLAGQPGSGLATTRAPNLEVAACLVQEDLCLMAIGDGPPVLTAAVICFPSHWRLADKIGRPMAAIHQPVPDYADDLGDRPDRVLENLADDRIVARRNWLVHDGGDLFAPAPPAPRPLPVDDVPHRLWLRSERQTLRALPKVDHVLFTIRVQQTPFATLTDRPDLAAHIADAVEAEPPDRLDRFAGGQVAPMLTWLRSCAH